MIFVAHKIMIKSDEELHPHGRLKLGLKPSFENPSHAKGGLIHIGMGPVFSQTLEEGFAGVQSHKEMTRTEPYLGMWLGSTLRETLAMESL